MNGLELGRLMVHHGLSFRRLGMLTGLSPSYLCLLAGGRRRPTRNALERIAAALELHPDELTHG